ncbi:MAG TPA: ParB/RepB/Spo0J family partition protein, partial [Candidatus Salinicoccus merdavium]|nr:ParB/RepB/Spo0J family partition protein [Candidatus Salinicoccus merdavium]
MTNNKKRLGKGLDALFNTNTEEEAVTDVRLSEIRKNPYQPRVEFDQEKLEELADSIGTHGVLQPIILRKSVKGYDIVVGERRFRASKIAGRETIPAIVKELSDNDMMELAIIENLQRENLNPLEEAMSYRQLMEKRRLTQAEVAERLGKSRPYIANMLRILNLPNAVKKLINEKKLSGAHGRTLLSLKDPLA